MIYSTTVYARKSRETVVPGNLEFWKLKLDTAGISTLRTCTMCFQQRLDKCSLVLGQQARFITSERLRSCLVAIINSICHPNRWLSRWLCKVNPQCDILTWQVHKTGYLRVTDTCGKRLMVKRSIYLTGFFFFWSNSALFFKAGFQWVQARLLSFTSFESRSLYVFNYTEACHRICSSVLACQVHWQLRLC